MVDYFDYKIEGCFLYFTDKCIVEAFHFHAKEHKKLPHKVAAKFFVGENGDVSVEKRGDLSDMQITALIKFIKLNHEKMFAVWAESSDQGYFRNIEKRKQKKRKHHARLDFDAIELAYNDTGVPIVPLN